MNLRPRTDPRQPEAGQRDALPAWASDGPAQTDRHRRQGDARERDLVAAVASSALCLDRRSVVALGSGAVVGMDAMITHQPETHPSTAASRQLLGSIDSAELVTKANRWLLDEALGAVGSWPGGERSARLFVVIMLDDRFVADTSFLPSMKESVRRAGLEPSQLLLSLDPDLGFERHWPTIQRLKSHGVRVALEDFTLGSPATELLRRFPFDAVRVVLEPPAEARLKAGPAAQADAGLEAAPGAASAAALEELRAVVHLAHNQRCRVMVEGVDDAEAVRIVRQAECDEGSGLALPANKGAPNGG